MNNIQLNQTRISRLHSIIDSISNNSVILNQPNKEALSQDFEKETQIYRTFNIEVDSDLKNMSDTKAQRLKDSVLQWEQQLGRKLEERAVTYGVFKSYDVVLMIKNILEKQQDIKNLFSTCTSFQDLSDKRVIFNSNRLINNLHPTNEEEKNLCDL